jgi:hypothetical protein
MGLRPVIYGLFLPNTPNMLCSAYSGRWAKATRFFNVSNTPHFSMPGMAVEDQSFATLTSLTPSPPTREIRFAGPCAHASACRPEERAL